MPQAERASACSVKPVAVAHSYGGKDDGQGRAQDDQPPDQHFKDVWPKMLLLGGGGHLNKKRV